MALTDSQQRHLEAIITLYQPNGQPPTYPQVQELVHSNRPNTAPAVARAVNTLEKLGAITVHWSGIANAEVLTPTPEGLTMLAPKDGTQ